MDTYTPPSPIASPEFYKPQDVLPPTNAGTALEPPDGYANGNSYVGGPFQAEVAPTYVERTQPPNPKLQQALALVDRGFHVFPLRPDKPGDEKEGKKPLIEAWQLKATRDIETVTRWFTDGIGPLCNIGVAYNLSGHCLIDVDVSNGKPGLDTWINLTDQYGSPPTLTFQSRSGGLHLIFRDPEGVIRTGANTLGPGIDTRGEGGYGVGPGSTICGEAYTVASDVEIADLPAWIAKRFEASEYDRPETAAEYNEDWAVEYAWQEMRSERGQWGVYPEPGAQDHLIYTRCVRLNELGTPVDNAEEVLAEWAVKGDWAGATADGVTLRDKLEQVYSGKHKDEFGTCLPPRWDDGTEQFADHIADAAAKQQQQKDAQRARFAGRWPDEFEAYPDPEFWDDDKTLIRSPDGAVEILGADFGHHKTNVTLTKLLDAAIEKGARVLYAAGEGSLGVGKFRVPAHCRARGISTRELRHTKTGGAFKIVPAVPLLANPTEVDAFIEEHRGYNPHIVALDTLATATAGEDENSARVASFLTDNGPVGRIKRAFKALVFLPAHMGKDHNKGIRGHSGFGGNVDGVLLQEMDDSGGIKQHVRKIRDGRDGFHVYFQVPPRGSEEVPVPVKITEEEYKALVGKATPQNKSGAKVSMRKWGPIRNWVIDQLRSLPEGQVINAAILADRLTPDQLGHESFKSYHKRANRFRSHLMREAVKPDGLLADLVERDGAGLEMVEEEAGGRWRLPHEMRTVH